MARSRASLGVISRLIKWGILPTRAEAEAGGTGPTAQVGEVGAELGTAVTMDTASPGITR